MPNRAAALVISAVIGLTLVLPASPTAAHEGVEGIPAAWHRASSEHELPARFLLERAFRDEDLSYERLLELRAQLLAAGAGQDATFHVPSIMARKAQASAAEDRMRVPVASGDLDGDGLDDVLVLDLPLWGYGYSVVSAAYHDEDPLAIEAVRGVDGSQMWRRQLGPDDAFAVRDLDGDGTLEVLLLSVAITGGPVYLLDQTVEVLDGADGTARWSDHRLGTIEAASASAAGAVGDVGEGAYVRVTGIQDLIVAVAPMTDADGDAGGEVFVGTLDLVDTSVRVVLGAGPWAARFVAETLAGSDGELVGSAEYASALDMPWVFPADDLSGDDASDLLAATTRPFSELIATDVQGAEHWRRSGYAYTDPIASHDLTGDGLADVLLGIHEGPWGTLVSDLEVRDGSTGLPLWATDGWYEEATLIGPAADGAFDLLLLGQDEGGALTVSSRDGRSGAEAWARSIQPDGGWTPWCDCFQDLSGDGIDDLLVASLDYASEEDIGDVTAISGATGSDLWTKSLASWEDIPVAIDTDANANGTADTYTRPWEQGSFVLAIAEGSDPDQELWRVNDPLDESYADLEGILGADVDGDGTDEVSVGLSYWTADGRFGDVRMYGASGRRW